MVPASKPSSFRPPVRCAPAIREWNQDADFLRTQKPFDRMKDRIGSVPFDFVDPDERRVGMSAVSRFMADDPPRRWIVIRHAYGAIYARTRAERCIEPTLDPRLVSPLMLCGLLHRWGESHGYSLGSLAEFLTLELLMAIQDHVAAVGEALTLEDAAFHFEAAIRGTNPRSSLRESLGIDVKQLIHIEGGAKPRYGIILADGGEIDLGAGVARRTNDRGFRGEAFERGPLLVLSG